MPALLNEVQVAERLNCRSFEEFRRRLKCGLIPAPTRVEGRTKLWSKAKLDAWIDGEDEESASSADLIKRLERAR